MPHPDDPEYGCAAAVAKWTAQGKTVLLRVGVPRRGRYRGHAAGGGGAAAGDRTTPIGRHRRRRGVQFWDFPDSQIRDTPELRAKIADTITAVAPDVVLTVYSGPEWAPGAPNQRDHIEFSNAVAAAYDSLTDPPRWLFENGPDVTHAEVIDDDCFNRAVSSLAAHDVYLSVLDPRHTGTGAGAQAGRHDRRHAGPEFGGKRTVEFILRRSSP